MEFGAPYLRAELDRQLPAPVTGLVIGVSGGADSASLLAGLAQSGALPARVHGLRAAHVDHGMQPIAAAMRDACVELCGRFGLPLALLQVSVDHGRGVSLEAAARDARYAALELELKSGECLLTAHHAEDQAETVLLQLLRGAGLAGLSGMPACRAFGPGWHVRPVLRLARQDLRRFGTELGILPVEDPMNRDSRFDRAFLRAELWPLLERRWPGARAALARSASHLAEAQVLLDQSASRQLARVRDGDSLSVAGLRALSKLEQINTVRHWIGSQSIDVPSAARLHEALRQMFAAESDHLPAVAWGEHALRRYRGRIFLTSADPETIGAPRAWTRAATSVLDLGPRLGRLRFEPGAGGLDPERLPAGLEVRRRQGGEKLKIGARARSQTVQHLCQSLGVLPWLRDALPLVYAGDALIAVGDLWRDARWCVAAPAAGLNLVWECGPGMT